MNLRISKKLISVESVFLCGLLLVMIFLGSGAGISGDEDLNLKFGGYYLDYFISDSESTDHLKEIRGPDYAYSYTFDILIEIVDRIFGFDDIHKVRHIANAICGWLILYLIFLIGRRYFSKEVGMLSATLLLISPRFLGHALNNPKDIPFAFGYIFSIYAILRFSDQQYKPKISISILVAVAIGTALNVRIGGMILFPFVLYIAGLRALVFRKNKLFSKKYFKGYFKIFLHFVFITLMAYFLMVITWPFALEKPLSNPFKALEIMSNIKVGIRQLFEGENISSLELPRYYTLKWMLISSPLIVIIGLFCNLILFKIKIKKKERFVILALLSFILIPLGYIYFKNANVYGGWRHSLFVYPPLVLLASVGLWHMYNWIKKPVIQKVFIGLVVVLCILPISHIARNYPVHYVYFNELVGGVEGAYGNYEMDYYMHSLKPGVDWLVEENIINEIDSAIITTNHGYSLRYYNRDRPNIRSTYSRYYERIKKEWDYAVFVNVYIDQSEIRNGMFPPTGTIETIEIDGKPICAIVKNPSNAAVGYDKDITKKDFVSAIKKLRAYNEADKNNFEAAINLAICYNNIGRQDSLQYFLSEAKRVNPQRYELYTKKR